MFKISEIRKDVDEMIVEKDKDNTKVTNVSLFEISPESSHFSQEMNFKQSKKDSIAQSIGLGTIMVDLLHGRNDNIRKNGSMPFPETWHIFLK